MSTGGLDVPHVGVPSAVPAAAMSGVMPAAAPAAAAGAASEVAPGVVPATMPAAVYKRPGSIEVEQVTVPRPGPGQVLLEVSHCGICGTDLHMVMEGWGTPGSIDGHEYSGVVVALGSEVDGWSIGDAAVGGPAPGCGSCAMCSDDRPHLCSGRTAVAVGGLAGAFARYKLVDASCLYRIPAGLDPRIAALTEPLAVALRGVRRSGVQPGGRALVTGAGPIGVLTVAVLRAAGVDDVTVSEPNERRRALAVAAGASEVIEPAALAVPAMPMDTVAAPFDVAIECSGRPDAAEAALGNLARGATLVMSGTGMRWPRFDTNRIILNELTITGTVEYTPGDFSDALGMLASGAVPAERLIQAEDVPLTGVEQAMARLVSGEIAGKVMVRPR